MGLPNLGLSASQIVSQISLFFTKHPLSAILLLKWKIPKGTHSNQYLDTLLVITTGEREAIGIWWVEARVLLNHPIKHRKAPHRE
jgi:hypothetical protein